MPKIKRPGLDKPTLPPPMREAIVDLNAEYSSLSLHEIVSIRLAPNLVVVPALIPSS